MKFRNRQPGKSFAGAEQKRLMKRAAKALR